MSEKLTIRNFGPIKDITIDLRKVNILIGEQATGKSTIAKVLAVCRYFSYINEFDYFENEDSSFSWGLDEHIQQDSYISYKCKDYSLEAIALKTKHDHWVDENINKSSFGMKIELQGLSQEFINLISELESINKESEKFSFANTPVSFFQNNVAAVMDNPFYLPAERGLQSIFSLGKSSIQNLSDSLFNQLAKVDGILRRFKDEIEIEPLDIFYKNIDGRGYVRKKKETKYYSLFNAATGYQYTIPVVLTMKYYNERRKKSKTFLIEEPELNLFPKAQRELVNYLVFSTVNFGNTILLTTHSPYVLTSLNNLMYAYEVGQKEPEETIKIIDKKYWINPNDVSAYMLLPDGTCEGILDREENLIKAEKIDSVSTDINVGFDSLINIEIGVKDEKY
jgi:predicted ATP-dependent endonuclease of OLD family